MLKRLVLLPLLLALAACTAKPKPPATVHLAIWSNYVADEAIQEFEKASGLKVEVSHYSSNEELLAKLQAGAAGIDVTVPTDYVMAPMIALGLLEKLDTAKIPSAAELDPKLKGQAFDPKNEFSLPYSFGTSGLAIDRRKFKGKLTRWADLFSNPQLAGKFSLFDDGREVIGMVLKLQGQSLNETDEAKLAAAKKFLVANKKKIKAFTSETKQALLDGEVLAAQAYSSDALQAREETKGGIEYLVPEEGATLWMDSLVIPKGAKNISGAHQLIDFLLSAKTGTSLTSRMWLATSNRVAQAQLPEAVRSNPAVFPPLDAGKSKLESMRDLGDAASLYERLWTEIKAE